MVWAYRLGLLETVLGIELYAGEEKIHQASRGFIEPAWDRRTQPRASDLRYPSAHEDDGQCDRLRGSVPGVS